MTELPAYVMGQTDEERQRLIQQSSYLSPLTELMLREGGLGPGMSVLDIGCGTGGASQIAARIVGKSGCVVGIDRDEETLNQARQLAAQAKLNHISFQCCTAETARFDSKFDAVIGRFVLIHQKDPLAVVRQVVPFARRGGLVAFLEPDFTPRPLSWPRVEIFERMCGHITELFVHTSLPHDMGLRLRKTLHDAGVRELRQEIDTIVSSGPDSSIFSWLAATIGSIAPKLEALGITTLAAIDLSTLEARLRTESAALAAHVQMFPIVAAWGRT